MTVAPTTKRRWWVYGSGSFILIVLIGLFSINSLLAPVIARRLKAAVDKAGDHRYTLHFSHLSLNVFTGTLQLDAVQLIADTGKLMQSADSLGGQAQSLKISGVQVLHYLFRKELRIDSIRLEKPVFSYCRRQRTPPQRKPKTLYEKLSGTLHVLAIGHIRFDNAVLAYRDLAIPSAPHLRLKELELDAQQLLIDSATQQDTSRTLFCKSIETRIRRFDGRTTGGLYHYQLSSASFSTADKKLKMEGLSVTPLPAAEFFKISHNDRFDFKLDRLEIANVNYAQLVDEQFFFSSKISGADGSIAIFGNPHGRPKHHDRIVSFPNYIIRKLPVAFRVDTLNLTGINVSYSQYNPQSGQTGTIAFQKTAGHFLHISNRKGDIKKYPYCTANLSTLLLGTARLNLSLRFNLSDQQYSYDYKGTLEGIMADVVNPVTRPLAQVEVTRGRLESLDFAIAANRYGSKGVMHMHYTDLEVRLLNDQGQKKLLPTMAVNAFVIKHSNPDGPGEVPRHASITFIRPASYPFFKTLWQTLFTGIKACAGIGSAVTPQNSNPSFPRLLQRPRKYSKRRLNHRNDF